MTDAVRPAQIVSSMIELGAVKARLTAMELLVRSGLAGAMLGVATTLAFTALAQTGIPIVGSIIFPVGFSIIVVLGLDLITGSFALLPMAVMAGRATSGQLIRNWLLTFVGNFIGALIYAVLIYVVLSNAGTGNGGPIGDRLRAAVESRTVAYAALGSAGMLTVFVKAMLCNWLVCLGVTMGIASTSAAGKIIGCWLPILLFFGQGFEHAVVNMSLFPLGLMLGAKATVGDWLLWNEIPVTVGNLVGGFLFTGLALYLAYRPTRSLPQSGVETSAVTF